jgi:hypothetical protein
MMDISKYIVPLIAAAAFMSSPVIAAEMQSGCEKPGAPQEIDGKVMKVDMDQKQITIVDNKGTTHVMKASEETLKKYKPGDILKATLRCPTN